MVRKSASVFDRRIGPLRILFWRDITSGWVPYVGTLYGEGLVFWWWKLWLEV